MTAEALSSIRLYNVALRKPDASSLHRLLADVMLTTICPNQADNCPAPTTPPPICKYKCLKNADVYVKLFHWCLAYQSVSSSKYAARDTCSHLISYQYSLRYHECMDIRTYFHPVNIQRHMNDQITGYRIVLSMLEKCVLGKNESNIGNQPKPEKPKPEPKPEKKKPKKPEKGGRREPQEPREPKQRVYAF